MGQGGTKIRGESFERVWNENTIILEITILDIQKIIYFYVTIIKK